MNDQRYYEIVADELQRRFLRPGLWTRAVAEAGTDGGAARALYIRYRVAELARQESAERSQAEAEAQQRREAEAIAREQEKREREQREAAERAQVEAERADCTYNWDNWLFVGIVILGTVAVLIVVALSVRLLR